jgi:transposase
MAASLFDDGIARTKIAMMLNVSRRLVNEWITLYLSGGIGALAIKKSPGRPPKLSIQEKGLLKDFVIKHSTKTEGGRLVGEDILRYIEDSFDVTYGLRNIYRLMAELNLSWITSRSKHPKQSEEAQEKFKKFPV